MCSSSLLAWWLLLGFVVRVEALGQKVAKGADRGLPPGPCKFCKGNHWNSQRPLKVKGKGGLRAMEEQGIDIEDGASTAQREVYVTAWKGATKFRGRSKDKKSRSRGTVYAPPCSPDGLTEPHRENV